MAAPTKAEIMKLFNKLHVFNFIDCLVYRHDQLLAIFKTQLKQFTLVGLTKKNGTRKMFNYHEAKTIVMEDSRKVIELPQRPFLYTLFRKTITQSFLRPLVLMLLTLLLIILGNGTAMQINIGYGLFLMGLILVGIPHGAVDHLLEIGAWNFKKAPFFIFKYLLLSAVMGVMWYFLPSFALIVFLFYSSWHFGQADGKEWRLPELLSFIWGISVLYYILGTHIEETNLILDSMGDITLTLPRPIWAMLPWLLIAIYRKQISFIITISWLILSGSLPLLFAFGLYFIGQHSFVGWQHIQNHLGISFRSIWYQSFPLHAGAWILLALFYFLWPSQQSGHDMYQWGIFFIFLACISLPHAIAMQFVYHPKAGKSKN